MAAWLIVTFFAGFGSRCSSKIGIAFNNVLGYLLGILCLYLHMLVQAIKQRKEAGGVVYKIVLGPFFSWWYGEHDGGPGGVPGPMLHPDLELEKAKKIKL